MSISFSYLRKISLLIGFTFLSITLLTAQKKRVHWSLLDNNRGKIFQRNHMEPFTGVAFDEHYAGKLKGEIRFKDGYMHGKAIQWDRDGRKVSETTYVKNKKQGPETIWYVNGKKRTIVNYVNDKAHGQIVEYHETGQKMSSGELVNGTENGRHTWWFTNGQKDQELTYNMGQVNGQVKNWYPNGNIKMISGYRSNQKQGNTTYWYENKNKMSIQHYKYGVEVDTSSFWAKNGRLKEQKIYNNQGKLIQHRDFGEASILTAKGQIHVFNKLKSNFIVPFEGKEVSPVDSRVLAFYVDGVLVQAFTMPKSEFSDEESKTDLVILKNLQEFDIERLENLLSDTTTKVEVTLETVIEEKKLKSGSPAMFWTFKAPGNSAEKKLTLLEEQFLAIVCQDHILLLNGLVFKNNKPDEVKQKLIEIANGVQLKDQPIDLLKLAQE